MARSRKSAKAKPKTRPLTLPQQALMDTLAAGESPPNDSASVTRLHTLRQRGLVTMERGEDGLVWKLKGSK